jgi:hypothetical protein
MIGEKNIGQYLRNYYFNDAQSEIDSIIGKNTAAYLVNLDKEYSLITKNKPVFSKPKGSLEFE